MGDRRNAGVVIFQRDFQRFAEHPADQCGCRTAGNDLRTGGGEQSAYDSSIMFRCGRWSHHQVYAARPADFYRDNGRIITGFAQIIAFAAV